MSFRTVLLLTLTFNYGILGKSDICYDKIGCLSMSYPWSSIFRQVPAPIPPEESPIKMFFYSRESRDGHHLISPFPEVKLHRAQLKPSRPTVIITHDQDDSYINQEGIHWMTTLKNDYLQNVDVNVIIMDWSSGGLDFTYPQAVANSRVIAKILARFLREISESVGILPKDVHLIGEGLGAHLMSYAANDFHGTGRITGLDPSREFFEYHDHRVRLDSSDAEFVDVIHTNARIFGRRIMIQSGDVDFYPNAGFRQPGCGSIFHLPKINGIGDISNLLKKIREEEKICNHRRAREYFIEAVKGNCVFWGHKLNLPEIMRNDFNRFTEGFFAHLTTDICTDFNCVPMGLNTPKYPARGRFLLTTRRSPPYCVRGASISLLQFLTPLKEQYNSIRSKVPFLRNLLPASSNNRPVP